MLQHAATLLYINFHLRYTEMLIIHICFRMSYVKLEAGDEPIHWRGTNSRLKLNVRPSNFLQRGATHWSFDQNGHRYRSHEKFPIRTEFQWDNYTVTINGQWSHLVGQLSSMIPMHPHFGQFSMMVTWLVESYGHSSMAHYCPVPSWGNIGDVARMQLRVQHPFWGHGEVVGWYTRHSIQILFFEWSQHSYCQESLSWSSFMMFYWLKSSKSQWTPLVSTTAEPGSRRAGVCLTVYPSTPLMSLQVPMKTVADTCTHRFHELHRWFWIAGPHRMTWLAGACWVYLILEIPVAHMISINYSAAAWFYHRSPKRKKERCLTIHVFSTKITQG